MSDRVEVTIAQMNGETDPPPIAVTVKRGTVTVLRVEIPPADFALCLTGRLVFGEVTRGTSTTVSSQNQSKGG
jgi:hypothetical protein